MEIKHDDYRVSYVASTNTIIFAGRLRLRDSSEYAPLAQLLNDVVVARPSQLTLDMQNLEFINSSAISMIYHFVSDLRTQGIKPVTVCGAKRLTWQAKALPTLLRLMPGIQFEFV